MGRGELSDRIVVYGILISGTACHYCSYVGFSVASNTTACNVYVSLHLQNSSLHFMKPPTQSVNVFRDDDQLNGVVNSGMYGMPAEAMEKTMWRQFETNVMLG